MPITTAPAGHSAAAVAPIPLQHSMSSPPCLCRSSAELVSGQRWPVAGCGGCRQLKKSRLISSKSKRGSATTWGSALQLKRSACLPCLGAEAVPEPRGVVCPGGPRAAEAGQASGVEWGWLPPSAAAPGLWSAQQLPSRPAAQLPSCQCASLLRLLLPPSPLPAPCSQRLARMSADPQILAAAKATLRREAAEVRRRRAVPARQPASHPSHCLQTKLAGMRLCSCPPAPLA